jgi:hypothetical protein
MQLEDSPTMKQYLLNICYPPDAAQPAPDALKQIMRDVDAVRAEMIAAGAWVFAAGLHPPSTSTVVRVGNGEILTTDGPFAEGKEYVGGFTVLRAPDLDAALAWAGKLARATTVAIEVRPLQAVAA